MLRGLARCDHTSKQSKGRIYSDIYCAPTKQSAALPRSPAVLLLRSSRLSRDSGLPGAPFPKETVAGKAKNKHCMPQRKNGNHERASGSPVRQDLLSSQNPRSSEIASSGPSLDTGRQKGVSLL